MGLADLLRTGYHHPVYVKSDAAHEVRTMLKARDALVAQRRTRNRQGGRTRSVDCSRLSGWSWAQLANGGSGGRFAVLVEEALAQRPSQFCY